MAKFYMCFFFSESRHYTKGLDETIIIAERSLLFRRVNRQGYLPLNFVEEHHLHFSFQFHIDECPELHCCILSTAEYQANCCKTLQF